MGLGSLGDLSVSYQAAFLLLLANHFMEIRIGSC